jgi:hypothetical protein
MMADYWSIVLFPQTVWAESRLRVRKTWSEQKATSQPLLDGFNFVWCLHWDLPDLRARSGLPCDEIPPVLLHESQLTDASRLG